MQPDTVVPPVRCIARQGTESKIPLNWDWVEASVWTERMLAALGNGVKGGKYAFFAERGLFTMHEAWIAASRSR